MEMCAYVYVTFAASERYNLKATSISERSMQFQRESWATCCFGAAYVIVASKSGKHSNRAMSTKTSDNLKKKNYEKIDDQKE